MSAMSYTGYQQLRTSIAVPRRISTANKTYLFEVVYLRSHIVSNGAIENTQAADVLDRFVSTRTAPAVELLLSALMPQGFFSLLLLLFYDYYFYAPSVVKIPRVKNKVKKTGFGVNLR